MEQNKFDKIFKNVPIQQKAVARAYMENNKHIKKTMKIVLDRELDDAEEERLRLHSFNLALSQVHIANLDENTEHINDE